MSELRLSGHEDFIPSVDIDRRIKELGDHFTELYSGEPLIIIALLSGAVRFAVHLAEAIDNPSITETYYRTSKMTGVRSSGKVALSGMPDVDINGKNTLVVEDIDHTRETLLAAGDRFRSSNPKRLDLVCLLNNVNSPKFQGPQALGELFDDIQYGFEIEDRFVLGFGLDYNGLYRPMSHVSAAHNVASAGDPELWVPIVQDENRVLASRDVLR
jgi:hypoxanthine phosphoribosyltransferase